MKNHTIQDRHLCWPPYFFLGPVVPPHFFHSRIATAHLGLYFEPGPDLGLYFSFSILFVFRRFFFLHFWSIFR